MVRQRTGYPDVPVLGYPIETILVEKIRTATYQAFRKRLGVDGDHLPETFSEVVAAVAAFVDPLLAGRSENLTWLSTARHWS